MLGDRVALSPAEAQVVSVLLADAWGPGSEIRGAEKVSDRRHVIRVHVATGRSVIVKRRPKQDAEGFGVELAALEYLNAMAVPVAPRLVGADAAAGLLLMEDLGPGASLADALLTGDRERAQADLVAYARAMGSMHAWSMGRPGGLAGLRARYAPGGPAGAVLAGGARARPGRRSSARGLAGPGRRRGRRGDRRNFLSAERNGVPRPGPRGRLPGQRAVPRRRRPDLRLRDLGLGPGRAGRRLPAGAVPRAAGASPRCPPRWPPRPWTRTAPGPGRGDRAGPGLGGRAWPRPWRPGSSPAGR